MDANIAKDDLSSAANCAVDSAQDKIVQMKGKMEAVGSYIDGVACKMGKEVSEVANTAGHRLTGAADQVVVEIRKYPVQSALIALGIGIIGTLFYKRSA